MEEVSIQMKCKEFDGYTSFLSRLANIGTEFILKNDVLIPLNRAVKDGGPINGKHLVKDPLFTDEESIYVKDGVYKITDLSRLVDSFKSIKEDKSCGKDKRKLIQYHRNKNEIYVTFADGDRYLIGEYIPTEKLDERTTLTANGVTNYQDIMDSFDESSDAFMKLTEADLINIRNGELLNIDKNIYNVNASTRIAKSLFRMAGTTRIGTPISNSASIMFYEPQTFGGVGDKCIMPFRIHATYSCTNVIADCIHEYMMLIYSECDSNTTY